MGVQLRQRELLTRMLQLNQDSEYDTWKVLVYDERCKEVVVPLFSKQDLARLGVTSYMTLHAPRQRIPDAPAVYFIQPTEENVDRIAQDCTEQLYDSVYINFSSHVSRDLLERLANRVAQSGAAHTIKQVFDQYCDFIALEPNLFSLGLHQTYATVHALDDVALMGMVERVVQGLFEFFVSTSEVPVIRAPPRGAAEQIARMLDTKLRNHLKDRNNMFSAASRTMGAKEALQRPLLVLLDRDIDLAVCLHHSWTYQSLVHDLFAMRSNRVRVDVDSDNATRQTKTYDLDLQDTFWSENKGLPFPKVAENVDHELKQFQVAAERVTGGASSGSPTSGFQNMADNLASAIDRLPELSKQRKSVEMHTNLASSLMKKLTERKIDSFFSVEEKLMVNKSLSSGDKSALRSLFHEDSVLEDKVRLLIMFYLIAGQGNATDVAELQHVLEQQGADLSCMAFLKKLHMMSAMASQGAAVVGGDTAPASGYSTSQLFGGLADKAIGKGIDWLAGSVKNLLPVRSELPVTLIVKELMNNTGASETDQVKEFLYFDPKANESQVHVARSRTPFKRAVVFSVGGGNYVEFQNLQDFALGTKPPSQRTIVYGTTDLVSPSEFVNQLTMLGQLQ